MADEYNIELYYGEDHTFKINYRDANENPIVLINPAFRMDIRKTGSTDPIWSLNSTDVSVTIDPDEEGGDPAIVDEGGDAVIDAQNGSITVTISRAFTSLSNVSVGTPLPYDGFLESDGKRRRIISGTITVKPSVTKWA